MRKKSHAPKFSGMPEFDRAVRGLVQVPKAELEAAIAKEREQKKARKKQK